MMKKHGVKLTDEQRGVLDKTIRSGRAPARQLAHARILLACGEGQPDAAVAVAVRVSVATVQRVRRLLCTAGLEAALKRKPQPPRPDKRRLDGAAEARLTMLACSTPPQGHGRWTLDLLADRMVRLSYVPAVSRDTVARALKKTSSSPG